MKYRELIQFDPITTNIELRHADREDRARKLVSSYVISDEMAERLTSIAFDQLQIDRPADNKGLLVVGNYGTGKSHLMSAISAVAEHADLAPLLQNATVAAAARQIAGRFKVIRIETGATTMPLREIIVSELESHLAGMGVEYSFPSADRISNNKGAFEEMMAAFQHRYPDHGLLLVVDELLDYLRSRKDQDLILDLNLLREIGELCGDLRFRFLAGLQEAIFDSSQFAFASKTLQRVRDRFEQLHIARRDVKYVVAERLLKKNAAQRALIREHLNPFARFYGDMNARMEEFVHLFPVHPDYVEVFERLTIAEKREVLRTISISMNGLLDRDVPTDVPGIIAFDDYWHTLRDNTVLRSIPDVREVVDSSAALEGILDVGFPRGKNRDLARRIIHGLSVYRLAVGDIGSPIGLTAEQLRDMLGLFDPLVAELGGEPAEDLRGAVETALRLISTTVSGQFISATERDDKGRLGGQFYLDVKKRVDYDAQIDKQAEVLGGNVLDRYYYQALQRVMECSDETKIPSFKIWEHELEWRERKAMRLGYLFFGAPNERSTAAPPRDFYLYFIQPHDPPLYKDEKRADELFFSFTGADDRFRSHLRRYAAALELSGRESPGEAKTVYNRKSEESLTQLVDWLRAELPTAYQVTHQGRSLPTIEWVKELAAAGRSLPRAAGTGNVRDTVNAVASFCLAEQFREQAPDYPTFSILLTSSNRAQAAQEALRGLAGTSGTRTGVAVLDALGLLDGDRIDSTRSRYANLVRDLLKRKGPGQVVNRGELIQDLRGVEYMEPGGCRLEPELAIVVLAALVHSGETVLSVTGKKFEAANLASLASTPMADLVNFKHVEAPREPSLPSLKALFELMDLPSGLALDVINGKQDAVQRLRDEAAKRVERLVMAGRQLVGGLPFWGRTLLSDAEQASYRDKLEDTKGFLESLQAYSNPGRLKNFNRPVEEVAAHRAGLRALQDAEQLHSLVSDLAPVAAYLSAAEMALPSTHSWVTKMRETRESINSSALDPATRSAEGFRRTAMAEMANLKKSYQEAYLAAHSRARLGATDDRRKAALLQDPRLERLRRLATVELLPVEQLTGLQNRLSEVKSCFGLGTGDMEGSPVCPLCDFRPAQETAGAPAAAQLAALDGELDVLHDGWTGILLSNLEDPTVRETLALMKPGQRTTIESFLASRQLPDDLSHQFLQAVREALAGLVRVALKMDILRDALSVGGLPATPAEMKKRFENHLEELIRGKEPTKVRLVVE